MTIPKNLTAIAVWLLLPVILLGIGYGLVSTVDGWFGVLLWAVAAVPLCVLADVLLRRPRAASETAKHHSLPRLKVRSRVHGAPEPPGRRPLPAKRAQPFAWGPDAQASRRARRK